MQALPRTVLLVVLALCPAGVLAQPERDAMDERMTSPPGRAEVPGGPVSVPMDMTFGKPAVEVMINGRGPYKLLVDTGAAPTLILNSDLAEELGLERIGTSAVGDPTDPEAIEVEVMGVESVRLGDAVFSGIDAIAWDRSMLYSGEGAPRGIIGFPLFHELLVTFDYPAGALRVEEGELREGAHVIPFTTPDGIPILPFSIGGETHDAMLDSGSMAALMLPMAFSERLELKSELEEVARARTVNSEFVIYAADYGGSMTLAGHEIVTESVTFFDLVPTPNIGSEVLGQFAVTFDQQNKLARFARPEGAAQPLTKPRGGLGLMLGRRGESYVVSGTVPGSPASEVDLEEGDVLVAVNGHAVSDLPPGDFAVEMRRETVALTVERDGERREVVIEQRE